MNNTFRAIVTSSSQKRAFLALAFVLAVALCCGAQEPNVLLRVEGDVKTPLALTESDLDSMPHASFTEESDGQTVKYEGVLLYDVLQKAGVPFGKEMPGKPMASYLLATARDGYQVVFALPEIDPAFMGAQVLVAYRRNGAPLFPAQRPVRLIAPQDNKMHARWIYSLIKLEVVRLSK